MTTRSKQKFLSFLSLAAFLILAAGSMDSQIPSDRPSGSIPEGNRVISDAEKGTTLQKNNHKAANEGKSFEFEGEVQDVTNANTVKVMLDSGNYATVTFGESVAHLEKGSQIKFRAKVEGFGTGILIDHTLSGGELYK